MHILVTNDDGPPSPTSSPYVHSFIRALQRAGHTVSVCLPHTQRSWIGKAHMIGETVRPTYYRPPPAFDPTPAAPTQQGTVHARPAAAAEPPVEEWVLVDGTPASCAQIGLHHLFAARGPIDLVVSGPNYGRNTTAVFALSSGTLGGALEASVCRKRAIALSYAFFSRNHDPDVIEGASAHSVRVIEKLWAQWPAGNSVDLYSVNVPLVEGVGSRKVMWTAMLQNYWGEGGACFQEVEGSVGGEDDEESRIREQGEGVVNGDKEATGEGAKGSYAHRHFKWAPQFTDVYKSVEEAPPGNDGWAVKEGFTSVTPLKANFWHAATQLHGEELKLDQPEPQDSKTWPPTSLPYRLRKHFYALVDYEDPYVQPLILAALEKLHSPDSYTLLSPPPTTTQPDAEQESEISLAKLLPDGDKSAVLQITPYEAIDWDYVDAHPATCVVNSYMLRKALIRKHYLAATVENWVAKRPGSALRGHVKRGEAFELDYAEFLDDALIEAFELRASLQRNRGGGGGGDDGEGKAEEREWWILKPGMSDRGQGIRLFSTMEELQGIFDEWEEQRGDSDEEGDEEEEEDDEEGATGAVLGSQDYVTASHLRHFVAQPYVHPPLLLPGDNRKFHIRTYVLCVGSLDVYVYREMLALFAGKPYVAPWEAGGDDLEGHLTNTCLQRSVADGTVQRFWEIDLPASSSTAGPSKEDIFAQICSVTGEVFEAAARGMLMHFQPLPNAFEVYGLDFLVDATGTAWLLEVNAFPDFKQTGAELQGLVAELWEGVLRLAVPRSFGSTAAAAAGGGSSGAAEITNSGEGEAKNMVHVRRVDLGRRWGEGA